MSRDSMHLVVTDAGAVAACAHGAAAVVGAVADAAATADAAAAAVAARR